MSPYSLSTIGLYLKKLFLPPKKEPTERTHHLDLTIDYYNYHLKSHPGFHIDARTWADLDMDQLFLKLDHTLTAPGEQVLYALLHKPCQEEEELEPRRSLLDTFTTNHALRGELTVILNRLRHDDGSFLAGFLWGSQKTPSQKVFLYWLAYYAVLGMPVLFFISPPVALYGFFILLILNTMLHSQLQLKLQSQLGTITYLGRMLQTAVKLSEMRVPILEPYIKNFREVKVRTKRLRRKLALGVFLSRSADYLLAAFNVLFLIDVRAYFSTLNLIERERRLLQEVYSGIGFIDSMLAVVSYRESLACWSEPVFDHDKPAFDAAAIYHPLLNNPVANDFNLIPAGMVLTGSNMSGKSTFLKTVGVNVLLTQTILTVAANSYSSCFWRVVSSIGRTDNLIEGKSYYLDEAQGVLRVIQTANESPRGNCLFIMDELFRGTNSGERVAAAVALLRYLADKGCCTLAATHDMEIPQLAGNLYHNYHFQEQIGASGLVFDYKLLEGPSQHTNAIEVLQYVGYPSGDNPGSK